MSLWDTIHIHTHLQHCAIFGNPSCIVSTQITIRIQNGGSDQAPFQIIIFVNQSLTKNIAGDSVVYLGQFHDEWAWYQ